MIEIKHKSEIRKLETSKVSLIASSLLFGATLSTPANADAPLWPISTALNTNQSSSSTTDMRITSTGSITANNSASALSITDNIGSGSSLRNSGVIELTNNTLSSQIIGIDLVSNFGSVTNSKTINVTQNSAFKAMGIKVSTHASTITNDENGTITVKNNASNQVAEGIKVFYVSNTGTITNAGKITVDGASSRGINVDKYNSHTRTSPALTNSGTITATVNGKADRNGYSIKNDFSYIGITNSGTLNGNLYSGKITNSGTISLPYNAESRSSAQVLGNFTQTSTGTLQIGLETDGTIANTTHSQLLVRGNVTFENGSTIDVNVLSSSTNEGTLAGETLSKVVSITDSGGSLTINGNINVTDNSALLDFELDATPGPDGYIDLKVIEQQTIEEALNNYFEQTKKGAGNSVAKENAKRLDDFKAKTNGMNDFVSKLNQCSSNQCVAEAIDELEVKLAAAGVGAAKQTAQAIGKIVRQRQSTLGGLNSGDEMFEDKNVWVKPFGTWGEQEDKGEISGYDVSSYGIGIGTDGINKDNQQFGLGLFYTNADVEVHNVQQSSDIEAISVLGYGSVPVIDEKTKFLYQVGYSWQMTDSSRETITGTAKADYTSKVASIDLKLMRDYELNDDWLLQPSIGTTYTHFTAPSYSENGAGNASLNVNKFTTSEALLNIGTVAKYTIDKSSKFITTLDLSYDMQDKNDKVSSTTQGGLQLADAESIDNGRVSYAIGLGYEKILNNNSIINFAYEYSGEGSGYYSNNISAKYLYSF